VESHVNVVMRKPFRIDELVASVEALIATSPTAPR
jgi:DNA-binding response OmpR family regulator